MSDETSETILIRDARPDDRATIVRFNLSLAEETERLALDRDTVLRGVEAVLADPSLGRYFLSEVDGAICGQLLITYEWSDWRNGRFVWIQSVWVEPEHRRRGIFRALYRHVERIATSPGHCGIRLYMHEENASAAATYSRLGLVRPGYVVF